MKNVKKLVAVLSAGLLLVLTGCSSTNSAATIGKTEIPLSTVQGSISEILKERAKIDTQGMNLSTGAELNTNAIRFHVISVIFDDIATKISLKLKDSEIAARRADIILQIGGEDRLASSLVGGMPATGAIARTSVNIRSGAKSRLAAIFHAAFLLVVVLALSPIISEIPTSALAGILIGTSYRMASPANLREMLRTTRLDSSILIITALVVIFLDLIWGILIGTALYYLFSKFKSYNLKRQ